MKFGPRNVVSAFESISFSATVPGAGSWTPFRVLFDEITLDVTTLAILVLRDSGIISTEASHGIELSESFPLRDTCCCRRRCCALRPLPVDP